MVYIAMVVYVMNMDLPIVNPTGEIAKTVKDFGIIGFSPVFRSREAASAFTKDKFEIAEAVVMADIKDVPEKEF